MVDVDPEDEAASVRFVDIGFLALFPSSVLVDMTEPGSRAFRLMAREVGDQSAAEKKPDIEESS